MDHLTSFCRTSVPCLQKRSMQRARWQKMLPGTTVYWRTVFKTKTQKRKTTQQTKKNKTKEQNKKRNKHEKTGNCKKKTRNRRKQKSITGKLKKNTQNNQCCTDYEQPWKNCDHKLTNPWNCCRAVTCTLQQNNASTDCSTTHLVSYSLFP